ncbi:MAG: STAS domain-containing protein [bacterium]|nr:STAS domain-containing protein [bacterium]
MEITYKNIGDVVKVELQGKLTLGQKGTGAFREAIRELLLKKERYLLLDMRGVYAIDFAGSQELVSAFAQAANQGKTIKLLQLVSKRLNFATVDRIYKIFEVYEDEVVAVRSF